MGSEDGAGDQDAAIGQEQRRADISGHDALVAPVFRHAERLPVRQPGQLISDLLALDQRHVDLQGEAVRQMAGHHAFHAPELVEIADHSLADRTPQGRDEGHAARRHVDDLTLELTLGFKHEPAIDADGHAGVPAPFLRPKIEFA